MDNIANNNNFAMQNLNYRVFDKGNRKIDITNDNINLNYIDYTIYINYSNNNVICHKKKLVKIDGKMLNIPTYNSRAHVCYTTRT